METNLLKKGIKRIKVSSSRTNLVAEESIFALLSVFLEGIAPQVDLQVTENQVVGRDQTTSRHRHQMPVS